MSGASFQEQYAAQGGALKNRAGFGSALVQTAIVCAVVMSSPALAQSIYRIDLPSQKLDVSLRAIGSVTGVNIAFQPEAVLGHTAPAVRGSYSPDEAIRLLLRGTSLAVQPAPSGASLIVVAASEPPERQRKSPPVERTKQATPAELQHAEQAGNFIEDIVVTARRRDEVLQSVPLSVQAFSQDVLTDRNIQSVTDMERLAPSLTTYQQARDEVTLSIRGQSSPGASAQGQNPRVTAYFAEVPLQTGDGGGPGRFFDLQNVQVLKGPQGTFFGRNSTGGAVLFEPKRPTSDLEGYVVAQYGSLDDREIEAALNLPVTNILAVRAAGKWAKRDGFTRNIVTGQLQDDRDYFGGRFSATLEPGGGFESFFMFDYLSNDTDGSSAYLAGYNPDKALTDDLLNGAIPGSPIPLTLAGAGPSIAEFAADPAATIPAALAAGRVVFYPDPLLANQLAAQRAGGPRVTLGNVDGLNQVRAWGFTNISSFDVSDHLSLKNIFGYRRFKQLSRYDLDGVALPLLDQTTPSEWMSNLRQITEEFQVRGSVLDNALDFTLGTFLLWQESPEPQVLQQTSVSTPLLTISSPVERSRAVFGQIGYDLSSLGLDRLKLNMGYRYTHDYRATTVWDYRDEQGVFGPVTCSAALGCPTSGESSFNSSSYNLGVEYHLTPNVLLYGTRRRAFRAGGLNAGAVGFGFDYQPETVTDYELGFKSDFRIGEAPARVNIAAFSSRLKGAQLSQSFSVQEPGTGVISLINLIVNAGSADIDGIETDFAFEPARWLELSGSYALIDGRYTRIVDVASGAAITGRPYPFLPKHRLTLGARVTAPIPESVGELTFDANYTYSSSYTVSVFKDPLATENGFKQLDLRADLSRVGGSNLDLGLFVNNATKELYIIGGVPIYDVLGTTTVIFNEPRTWGVQARFRF